MTTRRAAAVARHARRLARTRPAPGAAPGLGSPTARHPEAPVPPRIPSRDRDEARAERAGRDLETLPAHIAADLRAGKLSQRCPTCGTVEAAGAYCTRCYRPAGPADWFRQERGRPKSATYPNLTVAQRREILDQDNWTCGICSQPIDPGIPAGQPDSATVDHVISIHDGGDWYDPANLQAAHLRCNVAKDGGRPPGSGENGKKRGPGRPRAQVGTGASATPDNRPGAG